MMIQQQYNWHDIVGSVALNEKDFEQPFVHIEGGDN